MTRRPRTSVGRNVSRKDGAAKVTGTARYIDDLTFPGLLYGRTIRRTHHFKAHDQVNGCHVGDVVEIRESRPLSREKHWVVSRILKSGHEVIAIVDPTAPAGDS